MAPRSFGGLALRPNPLSTWLLLRSEPRDRAALDRFRLRHLRALLHHAYDRVPYYRDLFDGARIHPRDVRAIEDLRHVPTTERAVLQDLPPARIVARGYDVDRLIVNRSSGSSGRPLVVYRGRIDQRLLLTIWERTFRSFGLGPGDRLAVMKSLTTHASDIAEPSGLVARLRPPARSVAIDAGLAVDALVAAIAAARVQVLLAYAGQLAAIAAEVDPSLLRGLGLRFVLVGGEVLYPSQRVQIEAAFGVPVYEVYASTEFDVLAAQCPHYPDGPVQHIQDDALILEVEEGDAGDVRSEGAVGEVIGTSLHAFAMPMIRYRQADMAERVEVPCPCGTICPSLRTIHGRTLDLFVAPDDSWIHPYEIFVPIRERFGWIRRYEAIQRKHLDVLLRIEAAEAPSDEDLDELRRIFADRFAAEAELEIEMVQSFEAGPGKFKQYHSWVRAQPGQAPEEAPP